MTWLDPSSRSFFDCACIEAMRQLIKEQDGPSYANVPEDAVCIAKLLTEERAKVLSSLPPEPESQETVAGSTILPPIEDMEF
ncbi:MAG: hypothetical protein GY716_16100 [bacterium]|nr:hypothetical protein [bacterium]